MIDAKTQAVFIRKYGTKDYLKVQDKLHEKYNFSKIQKIFGHDMGKGLEILEEAYKSL